MFRLAKNLRKLKEKIFYICTPCIRWLIAIGLVFGLNEHQHRTDTQNYKEHICNTTVTGLKYTCPLTSHYHCLFSTLGTGRPYVDTNCPYQKPVCSSAQHDCISNTGRSSNRMSRTINRSLNLIELYE
jgi:hypothetical protein